jgi:hypothetical protein
MIPCEQTYVPLAKDTFRKYTTAGDPRRARAFALLNKGTDYQKADLVGFACRSVADDYEDQDGSLDRFSELLDELEAVPAAEMLRIFQPGQARPYG